MQLHTFLVPATDFLEYLTVYDLSWYVENKLDREPELATPRLLNAALAPFLKYIARRSTLKQPMLPNGHDHPRISFQGWVWDTSMIEMLLGVSTSMALMALPNRGNNG
jgi:hypothetical protein